VQYLTLDECRRLVDACDPAFRPLVQAALHTGARYGELIALNVRDFDRDAGAIFVADSKSGKPRRIYLSEEGLAFFEAQIAGRSPNDPMFRRRDGHRWGKSHAQRPLARACEAAGINPPTTFHALRHTYASHAVMAGAPLMVVAENLGHSDTRMVEKHYGHLAESFVRDTIRRTAPKFGGSKAA
jgi:integrase